MEKKGYTKSMTIVGAAAYAFLEIAKMYGWLPDGIDAKGVELVQVAAAFLSVLGLRRAAKPDLSGL